MSREEEPAGGPPRGSSASVWGEGGPIEMRAAMCRPGRGQDVVTPPLSEMILSLSQLEGEELTVACEILEISFQKLSVEAVAETAMKEIYSTLEHQSPEVRYVGLKQIHRMVIDPNPIEFPDRDLLGVLMVKCLAHIDLRMAMKVIEILSIGDWITREPVQREFERVMKTNSSNRCKCYEVYVNVAKVSQEYLDLCDRLGYLKKVVNELNTKDFLLQLNIVELLSNMTMAEHSLKYLIDNNVLTMLIEIAENKDTNPYPTIYIPALMKFFGGIAHRFPNEVFTRYPKIIDYLFEAISSPEPTILSPALDTLGFIGSTVDGKLTLCSLGRKITEAMTTIGGYLKDSPSDLKVRSLHCLEHLIRIKDKGKDPVLDNRASHVVREWFRAVSYHPIPIDIVFSMCKTPFPDLQLAALGVLHSVSEHSWGRDMIKHCAGMVEYLLNRSMGKDKEAKHAKYNIISILSNSSTFNTETILKLKKYVKEGPFYVEAVTEVAIEGD